MRLLTVHFFISSLEGPVTRLTFPLDVKTLKPDDTVTKCSMGRFHVHLWTLIRLRLAQPVEGNVVHQTVSFYHVQVIKSGVPSQDRSTHLLQGRKGNLWYCQMAKSKIRLDYPRPIRRHLEMDVPATKVTHRLNSISRKLLVS